MMIIIHLKFPLLFTSYIDDKDGWGKTIKIEIENRLLDREDIILVLLLVEGSYRDHRGISSFRYDRDDRRDREREREREKGYDREGDRGSEIYHSSHRAV